MSVSKVVIFGSGGLSKTIYEWLLDSIEAGNRTDFLGFLDSDEERWGQRLMGKSVLGGIEWFLENRGVECIVAIGNPLARQKISNALSEMGVARPKLIHPRAIVCRSAEVGEGAILCPNVTVGAEATIGRGVLLNIGSMVGHDCRIGDFVHVAPGVNLSGHVVVGPRTDIGTGSSVIQGVAVGADSVVGAGAVVTQDIEDFSVAVGVPARVIKSRR